MDIAAQQKDSTLSEEDKERLVRIYDMLKTELDKLSLDIHVVKKDILASKQENDKQSIHAILNSIINQPE